MDLGVFFLLGIAEVSSSFHDLIICGKRRTASHLNLRMLPISQTSKFQTSRHFSLIYGRGS